jgi:two-component system chemotaxis response regulator CheY
LYPLGGVTIVKIGPLRVVVADGRPLVRNLLRFILEENGFEVPAEAGTVLDAVRIVEQERPDVVVVHEDLARERDVLLLARLREIAPRTSVVLITKSGMASVDLLERVDAVIEEDVGLQDLSAAVRLASRRSREPIGEGAIRVFRTVARREPEQTRVRPVAAQTARILITQRAVALASGVDVSALDQQIRDLLLPLLPELPPETAAALTAVIGDLLGAETSPSPEPSASPLPTTEPHPSPSHSPPPQSTTRRPSPRRRSRPHRSRHH